MCVCSAHAYTSTGRLRAEVCDITRQPLPLPPLQQGDEGGGYDFALCMFVLSALPPKVLLLLLLLLLLVHHVVLIMMLLLAG